MDEMYRDIIKRLKHKLAWMYIITGLQSVIILALILLKL